VTLSLLRSLLLASAQCSLHSAKEAVTDRERRLENLHACGPVNLMGPKIRVKGQEDFGANIKASR